MQEVDHLPAFGILAERVVQKTVPAGGRRVLRGDAGGPGMEVPGGIRLADTAAAEIDHAVGRTQGVRVTVEGIGIQREVGGRFGLGEERLHAGGRHGALLVVEEFPVAEQASGVGVRDLLGHLPRSPQGSLLTSGALPPVAVPGVPAKAFYVAELVAVETDEQLGVTSVGEGSRDFAGLEARCGGVHHLCNGLGGKRWCWGWEGFSDGFEGEHLLSGGSCVKARAFGAAAHERPLRWSGRAAPAARPS
ncbi:hypothetical protein EES39_37665 [Streptomyces sp. ADI92-24]|nr:hypothetical protein EES39_37665 [Streptomyces sp. ADI92-24]